jgi:hypothetical protein
MNITNWAIRVQEDTQEISAEIDGFRLWYRLPKAYPVSRAGDPFLAAALFPAMLEGKGLKMAPSLSVSPRLLENLSKLQEIHHCWNPILKIISMNATAKAATPLNEGAMSFFSGGVDSVFTFLKHRQELTHVVFINGFDFFLDEGTYQRAVARNACFAGGFGKTLIPVETNYYDFGFHHNLGRELTQSSNLAGVALLLGFPRTYVPSSYSYNELRPWGSHPLTDPLYSHEATEIMHDGAEENRVGKIVKISECGPALAILTVCLNDINSNCGKCSKCLRTMVSLELLGVTASRFPPLPPLRALGRMHWRTELTFLKNNIDLAVRQGDDGLRNALLSGWRRYERTKLVREIDRVIMGGLAKRIYRKITKSPPRIVRIGVTPRNE